MARFTVAVAPGTLLIFFSTRATQDAQVIPPTARSMVPTTARASGMPAGACEPCGVAGAGAVCWSCVMVTILVVRKGGMRVCARSDQRAHTRIPPFRTTRMVTMTHAQHTAPAPATPHGSHAPAGIPDARAVVGTLLIFFSTRATPPP